MVKARNIYLSLERGEKAPYVNYADNKKETLKKMNSSEIKKFNEELKTKDWKVYKN